MLTALLPFALHAPLALAAKPSPAAAPDPTEDPMMITAGFLSGHPDLRFRLLGIEKRDAGKMEQAFGFFQRAGFYADKPSQAMVAEMLWNGTGTPVNRALAYAWMDLAAERGYEGFLDLRERYWAALTPEERDRALQEGPAVYARFGDEAARPRIDAALRREAVRITAGRIPLEVSGSVGLEGLRAIAEDGVDCISIGGLTKHVQAIDLSLKLGPPPG